MKKYTPVTVFTIMLRIKMVPYLRSKCQQVIESVISKSSLTKIKDTDAQLQLPRQCRDEGALATARRAVQQVPSPVRDSWNTWSSSLWILFVFM